METLVRRENAESLACSWQEELIALTEEIRQRDLQFIAAQEYAKVYGRQMAKNNLNAAKDAEKALEKARKEAEREEAKAEKRELERGNAQSEVEFIRHRLKQIYGLIEVAEDNQAATVYGGREWQKYEKQIMALENQAQMLAKRERKAKAILRSVA